jgi:hypothetical protein
VLSVAQRDGAITAAAGVADAVPAKASMLMAASTQEATAAAMFIFWIGIVLPYSHDQRLSALCR